MQTLGIDLSASDRKTAACRIVWEAERAVVSEPQAGLTDRHLLDAMTAADWTGIDAPFGWPSGFLTAVTQYAETSKWPEVPVKANGDPDRAHLRYRETDRFVAARARVPLSVSSDRIAVTAMRCAGLLTAYAEETGRPIDRVGSEGVVEVYPGAALVCWSSEAREVVAARDGAGVFLDPQGYKGGSGADKRRALLSALREAAPWLAMRETTVTRCEHSDDALDAVLSALVARAAARKLTVPPQTEQQAAAALVEGWIHLPEPGSLDALLS